MTLLVISISPFNQIYQNHLDFSLIPRNSASLILVSFIRSVLIHKVSEKEEMLNDQSVHLNSIRVQTPSTSDTGNKFSFFCQVNSLIVDLLISIY